MRQVASACGFLLALAGWMACLDFPATSELTGGGDVPDARPNTGEHYGACYPNGTCNAGLICRDSICLTADDPRSEGDAGDAGERHFDCPTTTIPSSQGATCSSAGTVGCSGAS